MEHIEWLRIKTNIPCQLIGYERMDDLATAHIWVGDVRDRGPILGSLAVTASIPGAKFRCSRAGRQQRRQPRCEGLWPQVVALTLRLGRRYRADCHFLHDSHLLEIVVKDRNLCQRPVSGLSAI